MISVLRRTLLLTGAACAAGPGEVSASVIQAEAVSGFGFVGRLFTPATGRQRTAVIMVTGSEGGFASEAYGRDLAEAGFPCLQVAYLQDQQGAPTGVPAVGPFPLESLFRAIEWMRSRPSASPTSVVLMGLSRGAEMVLLVASMRSDVDGVVAFSPGRHVWGTVGSPRDYRWDRSAWSVGGGQLFWRDWDPDLRRPTRDWFATAPERAGTEIHVERIAAPVLLLSSRADLVWPASSYADEIEGRMRARGPTAPRVVNLQFENASHLLMGPGPGVVELSFPGTTYVARFGGTLAGTEAARNQAWAAAKAFVRQIR